MMYMTGWPVGPDGKLHPPPWVEPWMYAYCAVAAVGLLLIVVFIIDGWARTAADRPARWWPFYLGVFLVGTPFWVVVVPVVLVAWVVKVGLAAFYRRTPDTTKNPDPIR